MKRKLQVLAAVLSVSGVAAGVALSASSPTVATGAATKIKQVSAVLNGTVNPNGANTAYFFQWGLTTAYGVNGRPHGAGSGTRAVAAASTATQLIPGTRYHYRLVAFNRFGTTVGADHTFKTAGHPPPVVATGPAARLGTSFATLSGVVNPHGQATSWHFDYGTTTAYGSRTFGGTLPGSSPPAIVASPLTGLAAGTIFHYRLVALHGSTVVSFGADSTFMTFPLRRPVPRVRARTVPHRKRHRPFVFTTRGSIGRTFIPPQFACSGEVGIRFFLGGRKIAATVVPVQPNCTFAGQTLFGRRPHRHRRADLRVLIHFRGTGYLAPSNARPESVVIG